MTTQIEIARASYSGTFDVVIYSRGPGYRDTYAVEIDGEQQFGGPADHIDTTTLILHPVDNAYQDGWNDYSTFAAGGAYRSAEDLGHEPPGYRHRYGKGWTAARRTAERQSGVPSQARELPTGDDMADDEVEFVHYVRPMHKGHDLFPMNRQDTSDLLHLLDVALDPEEFGPAMYDRMTGLYALLLRHHASLMSLGEPEPLP
jgi:hypothetical protein